MGDAVGVVWLQTRDDEASGSMVERPQ